LRKGDQLQIDIGRYAAFDFEQRIDRQQARVAHIHMGAYGQQAFAESTLLNTDGMIGTDGLFRFKAGGGTERPLSIFQVSSNATTVIQSAKQNF
jgi:hypothetical protein